VNCGAYHCLVNVKLHRLVLSERSARSFTLHAPQVGHVGSNSRMHAIAGGLAGRLRCGPLPCQRGDLPLSTCSEKRSASSSILRALSQSHEGANSTKDANTGANVGHRLWCRQVPCLHHHSKTAYLLAKRSSSTSMLQALPDGSDSTTDTSANKNQNTANQEASNSQKEILNPTSQQQVPGLTAGVNWFCLSMIGLVTLIDFSPLGPILRSTSGAAVPWLLAALQWGLFVAPTVNSCRSEGYDLRKTFGICG
jgi:hypothetical protein